MKCQNFTNGGLTNISFTKKWNQSQSATIKVMTECNNMHINLKVFLKQQGSLQVYNIEFTSDVKESCQLTQLTHSQHTIAVTGVMKMFSYITNTDTGFLTNKTCSSTNHGTLY